MKLEVYLSVLVKFMACWEAYVDVRERVASGRMKKMNY